MRPDLLQPPGTHRSEGPAARFHGRCEGPPDAPFQQPHPEKDPLVVEPMKISETSSYRSVTGIKRDQTKSNGITHGSKPDQTGSNAIKQPKQTKTEQKRLKRFDPFWSFLFQCDWVIPFEPV